MDFEYIQIICVCRLGFTHEQAHFLRFGKFVDLFEAYKKLYNFETKKALYKLPEEKMVASLMDL